ncbi:hypothetical protein J2848_001284 [Azospirillum lipoferum]|nr:MULTISPECIES: hypothetical protein [Azospirillum]MCP1609637.1 hypothetical protein [Azospirillum lipoferum]MDW5535056.1 hypothetical protein [Azospirillum sp. NL1]
MALLTVLEIRKRIRAERFPQAAGGAIGSHRLYHHQRSRRRPLLHCNMA